MKPELKRKTVEIDGKSFDFREPTIAGMLPILPKLSDPDSRAEAQLDILRLTVFQGDQPLGDQVGDLGWSLFMRLIPHALEVCGMAGEEDEAA
jgi:hypothetical protein